MPPPTTASRGAFITFEGVEGSGKSTQARTFADALRDDGYDVVSTREPGGTPVAERIRDVLLDPNSTGMSPRTEALLYAAARAEHIEHVIAPALRAGKVVVCDRFIDSSLAYQGHARGLGIDRLFDMSAWAADGLTADLVVLLDLDADEGMCRVRARVASRAGQPLPLDWREQAQPDRLEAEKIEFHRLVADGYRKLVADPRRPLITIDASQPVEAVSAAVYQAVRSWLESPARQTA